MLRFILILSSHLHLYFPRYFFSTSLLLTKILHVIFTMISIGLRFQTKTFRLRNSIADITSILSVSIKCMLCEMKLLAYDPSRNLIQYSTSLTQRHVINHSGWTWRRDVHLIDLLYENGHVMATLNWRHGKFWCKYL